MRAATVIELKQEPETEVSECISSETPRQQIDDLSSEKCVDYTRLRNLLAAEMWQSADYETHLVMLKVVGREKGDWIRDSELLNFPCTDLRTIDSLWGKYSNGLFGFSVQKKIYLKVGGVLDGNFNLEAWKKFGEDVGWWRARRLGERVGWRVFDSWNLDTRPPEGHLPALRTRDGLYLRENFPNFPDDSVATTFYDLDILFCPFVCLLFSRIQTCKV